MAVQHAGLLQGATSPNAQDPGGFKRRASLVGPEMLVPAVVQAFRMLHPLVMMRNPVMFITEIGAVVTTLVTIQAGITGQGDLRYFTLVSVTLWLTVVFANFAEALAEARGKAQADTLRKARRDITAHRLLWPDDTPLDTVPHRC